MQIGFSLVSDLSNRIKQDFFQAIGLSILQYRGTTWMLMKRMEKKFNENYTRMVCAVLNKSWNQQPMKQQLFGHLPPISKSIQVIQAIHVGHCWRSKEKLISDIHPWTLTHRCASVDELARTYIKSVRTLDVIWKTCWDWWLIATNGEREREREREGEKESQGTPCCLCD